MVDENLIAEITRRVLKELNENPSAGQPTGLPDIRQGFIPVGVSVRHLHVSPEDLETLYGPGAELHPMRPLLQPGEYAAEETVTLVGPKMRCLGPVRILGPVRKRTQVEVALTDAVQLGVVPPVRASGTLEKASSIIIVGPKGVLHKAETLIRANRHIHMNTQDARILGLKDNDTVRVRVQADRPMILENVQLRVSEKFVTEMHIDTDDANAAGLTQGDVVQIIR
jgi:putative phosphotransacetylase